MINWKETTPASQFEVMFDNPAALYQLLEGNKQRALDGIRKVEWEGEAQLECDTLDADFGAHRMDGSFLHCVDTYLDYFPDTLDVPVDATDFGFVYRIKSQLYQADPQILKPERGYYADERLERLKRIMVTRGIEFKDYSNLDSLGISRFSTWRIGSFDLVGPNGLEANINFGYKDENVLLREMERFRSHAEESGDYEGARSLEERIKAKKILGNRSLWLNFGSLGDLGIQLSDQQEFVETLTGYADFYKKVTESLYEERGLQTPQIKLIFETPSEMTFFNPRS